MEPISEPSKSTLSLSIWTRTSVPDAALAIVEASAQTRNTVSPSDFILALYNAPAEPRTKAPRFCESARQRELQPVLDVCVIEDDAKSGTTI